MDRVSELSDDILISILSRLSFQQVAATAILSTRWRHLHTRLLPLNFYFHDLTQPGFSNYVSRINRAIDSYKTTHHDKNYMHVSKAFTVHMPDPGHHLDNWLHFALSKNVQTIHLKLIISCRHNFLSKFIITAGKQAFLGVKELSLSLLYLGDRDVELILSNFVSLEHLSIHSPTCKAGAKSIKNLRVFGHSKLTHFNLSDVWTIESIQVRDMTNLVSLTFYQLCSSYSLLLESLPSLVHFHLDQRYMMLPDVLPKLSCIRHQLLRLKLSIYPIYMTSYTLTHPILINLKHMELNVKMADTFGTHQLFPFIEACPSLEKLDIQFTWPFDAEYLCTSVDQDCVKRKKPSYNLKKVRLSGYFGSVSELELVMYLMNNAVELQEVVVQVCDKSHEIREKAIARSSFSLQSVTPNSVNLVII